MNLKMSPHGRSQREKTYVAHDSISVRHSEEARLQRRKADERWRGSRVWDGGLAAGGCEASSGGNRDVLKLKSRASHTAL